MIAPPVIKSEKMIKNIFDVFSKGSKLQIRFFTFHFEG
jgi:hypothetical protein